MANFHEEEFSVRFKDVTPAFQERLRSALSGFRIESIVPDVAVVIVRPDHDLQPLVSFVQQENLHSASYSVWVSVVTSADHDGVTLPKTILTLIRSLEGGVDFSFVASLGDDNDEHGVDASSVIAQDSPVTARSDESF